MKFRIDSIQYKTSGSIDGYGDNVAVEVGYSIHESGSGHYVNRSFWINLQSPNSSSFTAWDDLTESQVIGWVTSSLGEEHVSKMQGWLDKAILKKTKPTSGFASNDSLPF